MKLYKCPKCGEIITEKYKEKLSDQKCFWCEKIYISEFKLVMVRDI